MDLRWLRGPGARRRARRLMTPTATFGPALGWTSVSQGLEWIVRPSCPAESSALACTPIDWPKDRLPTLQIVDLFPPVLRGFAPHMLIVFSGGWGSKEGAER